MIEFTLNRNRNGKKSRWAKKYPRKRILKRGSEKAAGWYFHNWYDDDYHYFHGDLHKFLLKNVGRPVDEDSTYLMVLLTTRRRARDLKVLMFHHLLYYHNSILRIFRVKKNCIIYVRRLRRHMRSSFLVHSISQMVYMNQEKLQYM